MIAPDAAAPETDTAADALARRVRELENENARLRETTASAPDAPAGRPRRQRWRAVVSAIILVIAAILVPVSIVSAWARVQLVDEETFVSTMAPLVDDPAVQGLIVDETVAAINDQIDFDQLTSDVFAGITDLGLPPRAAQALSLLQQPAADGLRTLVDQTVTRVVESEAFSEVWATATRAAHRAVTAAATSDGGGLVVRTEEGVGIQLGAVVERVKSNLVDRGVGVAQLIPPVDRVIIIGTGENLALLRAGYAVAAAAGWWLPVITLGLFVAGILFARRRSTGVLGAGLGLAVGAGALAASFAIGTTAVAIVASDLGLSPSALQVMYGQIVGAMTQTAAVVAVLGVFVALLGWLMGGTSAAQASRGAVHAANAGARRQLAARGLNTGRFGDWLGRNRVLVRVVVTVLAVLWLFLLRPLSFGDLLMVVLVAVVVTWLLELLQRRPVELGGAAVGDEVGEAATGEVALPDPADVATATDAARR